MERICVNTVSAREGGYSAREEELAEEFTKGQVVEGVITKVSDQISLTLNGKELQVPSSLLKNAKEGQIRNFEVTELTKQSMVVKEVEPETKQSEPQAVKQTIVAAGNQAVVGDVTTRQKKESLEIEKEEIKAYLSSIIARLSEEDYQEMSKDDTPIENYSKERFERTLNRIKSQKQFKSEHLEEEITKKQTMREEVEEATKDIKKRLQEENLPATESNIAKVAGAMELAAMSSSMTDASKAYLIGEGLNVTPEAIYKSVYSGVVNGSRPMTEGAWKELQPQVEEFLKKDGLETDGQTLSDAKWLLQHGLSMDKKNITTLGFLNELGTDASEVLPLCIANLAAGGEPKETDLMAQTEERSYKRKAKDTMILLSNIPPNAVEAVPEGEPITLEALAQIGSGLGDTQTDPNNIAAITARRQLEEVRIKLTMETSYQLYRQGIQVNTAELSKLVEELRALEDTYYSERSKEYGIDLDQNGVISLKKAQQMIAGLKNMPASILGSTFDARTKITLSELYEEGAKAQSAAADKSQAYETLMTAPRSELGDSIKKAFESVSSLLDDLHMEQTKSNERAVRILAYNEMPITKESITAMKSYDLQVNQLLETMTPEVTLQFIREGNNPLDLPVQEVSKRAQEIVNEIGKTSEEKFSEYLYNLEKKDGISKEERDSYIGIYRLLHQVEKSDGAAIGAVVKADRELTLGNLLTAVRSKNHSGMDISMDETFGRVESIQKKGASISEQVETAFYANRLATEAFDGLSVDAVSSLQEQKENLFDVTLEELYEKEQEVNNGASSEYTAHQYEAMKAVVENASQSDVLVYANLEVTVNNLEAAEYLLSESSTVYKDMKAVVSAIDQSSGDRMDGVYENFYKRLGDDASLQEGYRQLEEARKEAASIQMEADTVTTKEVSQLRLYQNVIHLAGNLSKERIFEIPVKVGNDVLTMKVQMVDSKEGQSKVSIHMEDEEAGSFDAVATAEDGMLSACIMCDNAKVADYYEKQEEAMKEEVARIGLTIKQFVVTRNRKQTDVYDTTSENTKTAASTEALYEVAKLFVATAKKAYEQ